MNLSFEEILSGMSWLLIHYGVWLLIPIGIIFIGVLIWWFNPTKSLRLRWTAAFCCVRFCELTGDNYTVVDAQLVSLAQDVVTRNKKGYCLDFKRAIKDSNGRSYLYFDIDNAVPITTAETTQPITEETKDIEGKPVEGGVILGKEPSGTVTLKYTKDDKGKPLLWYNPSALDAELYASVMFNNVWGEIGRSKLEKYALYIVVALVIGIIAIAGVSAWQINNLSEKNAELTREIIELLSGGVKGG